MRKKSYKIYRLSHAINFNYDEDIPVTQNVTDHCLINLDESFTIETILGFSRQKYIPDMIFEELILVELSENENVIDGLVETGFKHNEIEYEFFMSSPSWQKKSESGKLKRFKGCGLFIKKGSLKHNHDLLISLGMNLDLFTKQPQDIAKLNARFSLGLTGAKHIDISTNYTVVKNMSSNIIEEVLHSSKGNPLEAIRDMQPIEVTLHDGMGLISKEFAERLAKRIGLDKTPSYFVIRQYGMAVKGLLVVFDIKKYFAEYDIKTITDFWGNEQNIEGLDFILTDSMAKWCKNFRSMEEFKTRKNKYQNYLINNDLKEVAILLDGVWITKYEQELPIMTRANYQLLSNLSLTKDVYWSLTEYTLRLYMDIFRNDYDKTMLWLKDIVENKEVDEDGEIIKLDTATSKLHELLRLNPNMQHEEYVHEQLRKMLRKKMKEILTCKIYIKGAFRTLAQDPFALIQHICGQDVTGCLGKNEFYETEEENGKIKTYSRNPLNHYGEIINRTIVKNELNEKWLSHLTGLTIVDIYGLSLATMSGADVDGDLAFSVDDEIIRNSVVPELPVIYIDDGSFKAEVEAFTEENRRKSYINGMGSMIGSIANTSTTYSVIAQRTGAEGFYNMAGILTYLRDKGMAAIDAQKTGQQVELCEEIKTETKPYFFCFLDKINHKKFDVNDIEQNPICNVTYHLKKWSKKNFLEIKETIEEYSEGYDRIKLDEKFINKSICSELLIKYEAEEQYSDDSIKALKDMCLSIYKNFNEQKSSIRQRYKTLFNKPSADIEFLKNERKKEMDKVYLHVINQIEDLKLYYNEQVIANAVARYLYKNNRSKSFLYRFCWNGVALNIRKNSNFKQVRFKEDVNGEYEFLGRRYCKFETTVATDEEIRRVGEEELRQKAKGIINRSIQSEVNFKSLVGSAAKELLEKNIAELVEYQIGSNVNLGLKVKDTIVGYLFNDQVLKLGHKITDLVKLFAKVTVLKEYGKNSCLTINLKVI